MEPVAPVEPVAPEHIHHAILEVFRRRQSRTPDDLSAALRDRIIAAIEASGVGRDAYAERVRARDAKGNAALDDALAELGRQGAKREALLRAFETTGKTEAEFADMYGMEPREVTRTRPDSRARPVIDRLTGGRLRRILLAGRVYTPYLSLNLAFSEINDPMRSIFSPGVSVFRAHTLVPWSTTRTARASPSTRVVNRR